MGNPIQLFLQMLASQQQQGQPDQPAQQMSQQGQFNPADIQAGLQGAGPSIYTQPPPGAGKGMQLLNALANAGRAATYVAEDPRERMAEDSRTQQLWEAKQKMALAAGEFGQREQDRSAAAAQQRAQFGQKEADRATQLKIAQMGKDTEAAKLKEEERHNLATEGKPLKPDSVEQQFVDWYMQKHPNGNIGDAVTAYNKANTHPEKEPKQLAVAPDGTVVELRPGAKVPQGTTTLGGAEKQQQAMQGAQTDINFANNYVQSKKFDGPHDEALIEKFFDMTKPSSGFRMTQPQIDMALHARSALQGIVAQGKHLISPNAPYLDDTQRQNIVRTMNDVMSASQSARAPQGSPKQQGQPQSSNGRRVIDLTQ